MPFALSAGLAIANFGGQIFSGIAGQNNQQWSHEALSNVLNKLEQFGVGNGNDIFYNYAAPLGSSAAQNLKAFQDRLFGDANGSEARLDEVWNGLNPNNVRGMFSPNASWGSDQTGAAIQNLFGLGDSLGGGASTAMQGFLGGGWTPQGQQGFDQLSSILRQNDPGLLNLLGGQLGEELINTRGNNQFTEASQEIGQDVLKNGGYTEVLRSALPSIGNLLGKEGNTSGQDLMRTVGASLMNRGGLSGDQATAQAAALRAILGGGQTPESQRLSALGFQNAKPVQLMSPLAAREMAMNEAMTAGKSQAEHAYAQALARGGGPGSVVANGMQNQGLADFNDRLRENAASQGLQAFQGQQGLGLQQNQLGTSQVTGAANMAQTNLGNMSSLFGNIGGLGNAQMNTGANLMQNAEALNNQRLLGGLNFIPNLQSAATGNASAFGNLGLGATNAATQRMQVGLNQGNQMTQNQIAGQQAWNSALGNQNQYALGLGGLANTMTGTQAGINNNIFQNLLGGGQLGAQIQNNAAGAYMQNQGNQLNYLNTLFGGVNNAYNPLLGLAGQGGDILRTGLSGMASLFGGATQGINSSPWNFSGR